MTLPLVPALRGLYAITDGPRDDLLDACAAALEGGAAMLQYRDKTRRSPRAACDEARALAALCARHRRAADRQRRRRARGRGRRRRRASGRGRRATSRSARARLGPRRDHRRVVLRLARARARSSPRPARTISRSARSFPRRPSRTRAARRRQLLRDAQALGVPLVAIGGITPDNARGADRRRRRLSRRRFRRVFGARRSSRAAARRFSPDLFRHADYANPPMTTQPRTLPARPRSCMPGGVNSPVRAFKSVGGEPFFTAARRRRVSVGRRRQALHRLRRLLGPDDRRPQPSARARSGASARSRDGLSFGTPCPAEVDDGRDDRAARAVDRDGAHGQLRHRGDDVGDPPRARRHRPHAHRQVRRLLPRPRAMRSWSRPAPAR